MSAEVKKMVRTSTWIALSAIAIGLGVPAVSVYYSITIGFNYIVAGIIAAIALFAAASIAIVGIILGPLGQVSEDMSISERQKMNAMRAHQRATLEELDDIIDVLKDIREVLKAVEE